MRVNTVSLAALLAVAAAGAHAQQPVRYPKEEKVTLDFYPKGTGWIEGTISGAEDIPGRWLVALKSDAEELKFLSRSDGSFKIKVPVGVYAVQVRALPGETEKAQQGWAKPSVEFPRIFVRRGFEKEAVRIEVDPTYEYIRCTKSSERVLPLTISHGEDEAHRELRAPVYRRHTLPSPGPEPFYLVVQACGESKDGPLIKYEDAILSYSDDNATVIAADKVTLDTRNFKLTGRIYYYTRGGRKTTETHISARLAGRAVVIDSTGRDVSSTKRRGRR